MKSINCEFLRSHWPELAGLGGFSEAYAHTDPVGANRYKEIVHEEVNYDPPQTILKRLKKLESDIATDLQELEAMLG